MVVVLTLENATVILNHGPDICAIVQFAGKDAHMDIATNLIHVFVSLDGKGSTVLNVLRTLTATLSTPLILELVWIPGSACAKGYAVYIIYTYLIILVYFKMLMCLDISLLSRFIYYMPFQLAYNLHP